MTKDKLQSYVFNSDIPKLETLIKKSRLEEDEVLQLLDMVREHSYGEGASDASYGRW